MAIHWCGTGLSAIPGLRRLIEKGYETVVWNRTIEKAKKALGDITDKIHAFDKDYIEKQLNPGDIIVSMLPSDWHVPLAELAISKKANFVSSSYIAPEMKKLDGKAKAAGVTLVNEIGLDPGIDHLMAHKLVEDRIVDRIQQRVLEGMGLLVLHSGHHSKIFKRMMGTTANIRWAERGEKERIWICNPGHPIAEGLDEYFEIEMTEMYGEPFQVPAPDETVFVSWFEGGEVFRSGLCYKRGNGKIFYFRPGHESYPVYYNKDVQRVIKNSVHWVCPEKTSGIWIDRIAKGIDNMERTTPVEPIEVKGYQVDHNYKK